MTKKAAFLLAVTLAGCASVPGVASQDAIPPRVAIERAAALAPGAFPGTFLMRVQASGRQDGMLYLNSETDYRDQRNLSIEVAPVAQAQLELRLGAPADVALRGRVIRVDGAARRVRIAFLANGRATDKYYYQTHVAVRRGDQLLSVD
jgi:hypothetical protein